MPRPRKGTLPGQSGPSPSALKPYAKPGKPLGFSLLEAFTDGMEERAKDIEAITIDGEVTPLPGAEMPWREWCAKYATFATRFPFAKFHEDFWEWGESLEIGKTAPAKIECWARGFAKSTTTELVATRACVRGSRRFALYVCAKQEDAEKHVATIAAHLESCGIDRATNKFGISKGWNASKLRASNGFNVLAVGLDGAIRGVKLDNVRPDLIILDDIDDIGDSVDEVERKIRVITQTILPTRSTDCAVIFIQNRIHANSIMARVISGDLDMLVDRVVTPIIPAIMGLEYKAEEGANGLTRYKITGGTPTWEGKPLDVCQNEIDTFGIVPFLRECQHEVGVGGRFFPMFAETDRNGDPWHVVDGFDIPPWWRVWGSHDFGTGAPCCFLLFASDEQENIYVIGEIYEAGLTSSEQCQRVIELLASRKLAEPLDPKNPQGAWKTKLEAIAFDYANTFPPQDPAQRIGEYPVEVWWRRGLNAIMAVKDRKVGWRRVKEDLRATRWENGKETPRFKIFRGVAPNLVVQLQTSPTDPKDPEELDKGFKGDHADDALRYGLLYRTAPVKEPKRASDYDKMIKRISEQESQWEV